MEEELFDPRCLGGIEMSQKLHWMSSIHDSRCMKWIAAMGPKSTISDWRLTTWEEVF